MLEKQIERKLVESVRHAGGLCPKFISPGMDGMPDRLVLMPGGRISFVELKAPGKQPRPLQLHRHDQLRSLGFEVCVIDSLEAAANFVETLKKPLPQAEGEGAGDGGCGS